MDKPLPDASELEQLSLRAVVAYAARAARRVSVQLQISVPPQILENALQQVEAVLTIPSLRDVDQASILRAAEQVAAAYANAPKDLKSVEQFRAVFAVTQAAITAMGAVDAAVDSSNSREHMRRATRAAARVARKLTTTEEGMSAANKDARQDYDALLEQYGQYDHVTVGEPIRWTQ